MDALLDMQRLCAPAEDAAATPFPLFVLEHMLPDAAAASLDADFPRYRSAGFFPYDPSECGPAVRAVVELMTSPAFGDAVGRRLGIDGLGAKPTLATPATAG